MAKARQQTTPIHRERAVPADAHVAKREAVTDNTARMKATLATHFIEQCEVLFLRAHNPIHAWRAYDISRHGGVAVPDWVLDYFDKVAKTLTAPNGPASPKAVADALGLGTKGGPSKTLRAQTEQRHQEITDHVLVLQELATRPGAGLDLQGKLEIMLSVAEEYGLSLDRVQAVYYELIRPASSRKRHPSS